MNHHGLPPGWTEATIGDLVDRLQYGLTAKAAPFRQGPRFLRITDLDAGRVDWSTVPGCDLSKADLDKYRLIADDIVFARTGSIEKAARIVNPPEAVFASYLIRGRPVIRDIAGWLGLFVGSYSYVNQVAGLSAGIGRANVNAQNLATVRIELPPISEQLRIVEAIDSYLTRLDDAIASLERIQTKLKAYRASVLKAAVEGRLVPTEAFLARAEKRDYEPAEVLVARILKERRRRWEEAELAKLKAAGKTPKDDKWKAKYEEPTPPDTSTHEVLPEGWCWASVEQLGFIASGQTPSGVTEACSTKGDVPWFRVGDMNALGNERHMINAKDFLTHAQVTALRLHVRPAGTIIFPKRGGAIATNKKRLLQRPSAYDLNTMGVVPIVETADYLWKWFLNLDLGNLSDGSNVPQINHDDIAPLAVALPPVAEGHRIVEQVERLLSFSENALEQVRLSLRRCTRLRQAVLKWAFEGKLVDQDPNDEPADNLLARIRAGRVAFNPTKKTRGHRAKGAA